VRAQIDFICIGKKVVLISLIQDYFFTHGCFNTDNNGKSPCRV